MLGKLLKYEFIFLVKDFARTYIVYGAEVLMLSLLLSTGGGSSGDALSILTGIFGIIYYIFTMLLALLTITHNVRRFKKNMFSHEGYLTNTLPVTPSQHVIAKVIAGAVNYVLSFLVIYIGMLLLFACSGHADDFRKTMDFAFEKLSDFGLLFPTFLMFATGYLAFLLCCYLVSSIGSMVGASKGGSVFIAVIIVIGYIFVSSAISSAMLRNGASAEGVMYFFSFFYAVCAAIEFVLVTRIIKYNLNLQ